MDYPENQLKQPKELLWLFFAEMWERFSFYGMRALLILFMVKEFLYSDDDAYHVYAAYGTLVYTTPFIGGMIADRLLGYRKSVMLGGTLMAIGHFIMVGPDLTPEGYKWLDELFFYTALAFLIVGNGFFKPNISSIVGTLYTQDDPRRDAGFTIFYMGVNLGAFLAPLLCGVIGEVWGWGYGFGLAGVGMVAGLFVFRRAQKYLYKAAPPSDDKLAEKSIIGLSNEVSIYLLSLFMVVVAGVLINFHSFLSSGLYVFGGGVLAYILYVAFTQLNQVERHRMFVILTLLVFSAMFWAFFEQAGSSITLFTDRNVNRNGVPSSLFQSVNPLFILLLGSAFSAMWMALGKRGRDLSIPAKFTLAMLQVGLGFGALYVGTLFADKEGMVAVWWLLLGYLLHTTGELCLSPVGLSMVTRLAPKHMVAMILGAWYLSSAFAHNLGGLIAGFTSTSAYMENTLTYAPNIDFVGRDTIKYTGYETYVADKATGTRIELAKGEKMDTTKHRIDTLQTEEITLNIFVVAKPTELKPNPHPKEYIVRKSVKPGDTLVFAPRLKQLDPFGDLMDITMHSSPAYGDAKFERDTFWYVAHKDAINAEPIEFRLAEKKDRTVEDVIQLIVTVDTNTVHAPKAMGLEANYYMEASTAFSKNELVIFPSLLLADADGSELSTKITQKPSIQKALLSNSNALNPFVTTRKTIQIYSTVFFYIMSFAFGATVVLLLLIPALKKWVHEGVNADEHNKK